MEACAAWISKPQASNTQSGIGEENLQHFMKAAQEMIASFHSVSMLMRVSVDQSNSSLLMDLDNAERNCSELVSQIRMFTHSFSDVPAQTTTPADGPELELSEFFSVRNRPSSELRSLKNDDNGHHTEGKQILGSQFKARTESAASSASSRSTVRVSLWTESQIFNSGEQRMGAVTCEEIEVE
jgi:hypothetical protein